MLKKIWNHEPRKKKMTKKYKCTIDVDESHVKRFDLTFEAEDEQDAEAQALMEVKQNLHDYITVCAEEEDEVYIETLNGPELREKN